MNPNAASEEPQKVAKINPWIGIWWDQRATLRYAWQNLLDDYIHRLFILMGFVFMLAVRLPDWSALAPHPIGVMVQMLLFAPLGGVMAGYVFAATIRAIGGWMGKQVPSAHTKSMVAWSNLPFILFCIVFMVTYWLLDKSQAPLHPKEIWLFQSSIGWVPLWVALPFYLYAVVVRIRCIMVLLGVGFGRAFLTWIGGVLIPYVPAAALVYVFMILYFIANTAGG